jgi:hypothetical protein
MFDGAYGPRVVDQLRYVVDCLWKDPMSRQAVMEVWRPNPRESLDIPCTLTLQWLIRDGKLHCIDSMRSSDAWLGWVYDVFSFSMLSSCILLMLSERAKKTLAVMSTESGNWDYYKMVADTGLGTLYLVTGSSHLYVHPKEDGAAHVPYDINDVRQVVLESRTPPHTCGHDCPCFHNTGYIKYNPLDLGEFSSASDLVHHLELIKDRKDSGYAWLRELLLT